MIKPIFHILLHRGHLNEDGYNLRRWFLFYITYLIVLTGAAMIGVKWQRQEGGSWAQLLWLLALYLFYLSLCCTFLPAPTAWIVLLMASPMIGLHFLSSPAANAMLTIIIVAAIGALGTALANLNEYHIFTFILRFRRIHQLRDISLYQKAARWFDISPFLLITVANIIPIPVDIIRWLAITHRYRRDCYFTAAFLGRFVRYGLLATTATCLSLSWTGIAIIQGSLVGLIGLRYLPRLTQHRKQVRLKEDSVKEQEAVSA